MPVHHATIGTVVLNAWKDALYADVQGDNRQDRNRKRSSRWVDALARCFRESYGGDRYRVFWSHNKKNRKHFGRNEMLFDIAVCSVSKTRSLQRNAQDLEFVAQCHWQIESEFSRTSTREIVIDMSKLVMGSAENKLFIAAHRASGESDILEQCSEIAGRCTGRVYFCFVSHPDEWADDARPPVLFEWVAGGWSEIALPAAS